jgi:RNA polymerase sigma factor (sigma-70 family)
VPDDDLAGLVRRAAGGDEDAWNAIVTRFERLVYATIRGLRLNAADTEDVWQTTWLRLAEHIGRLREPQALGGWLAQTARHEGYRMLRLRSRELATDDAGGGEIATADAPAEAGLVAEEEQTAVWRSLHQLSDACQRLLRVLSVDPPPSYEEVSAALDMPIGSIGPTRARCLEKLRKLLAESGYAFG